MSLYLVLGVRMIVVPRTFSQKTNSLNWRDQSGQIAVVVFLIMAVLLVVGLSLATRTSQEIEQAGQAEDTTRVFNAAESGIEKALDETNFVYTGSQTVPSGDTINQAEVALDIQQTPDFSPTVQPGQSVTVYTTSAGGTLNIYWGQENPSSCANQASIIVTQYYENGSGEIISVHDAFNPYNLSGCPNNQFYSSGSDLASGAAEDFHSRARISINANTRFIRIKPLYASAQFKVTGDPVDTQAHVIRSQATDVSGSTSEVRTIEVTRTRPAPPSILDYALYSGGTLVKN